MSGIGPQLPPHLAKRKRSTDDTTTLNPPSPPTKIRATSRNVDTQPRRVLGPSMPPTHNEEEIGLDSSSDDEPGSSLPPGAMPAPEPKPRRVMGPAMPPPQNTDEIPLDDSSDDDVGPFPPPSTTTTALPAPRRILGPAPPPALLSERPTEDPDSSSDDDYGPSLPPAPGSAAAAAAESAIRAHETARAATATASAASSAPKRADWMLVPPGADDWTSRVDPTKLKTRKFASGKGAKALGEKSGVSAIWTETPEEKRQRLEDEVLGRKEVATNSGKNGTRGAGGGQGEDEAEQAAIAKRIRGYNERMRGKSMVEEHTGRQGGKEEEDDPSKRGFDKEKDMGLGGRIGHVQKQEMLRKAGDFGSRFERGKFL
ncbi:hypothetical protein VC83_06434 [Pseudogymnoascus destructans]|uniref:DUF3752 domain-containing protein n=1 Tax=Pseudogymnoascus destructans TaxID=655981 RepID=A0A177AB87_9PEZI|nr:uncharacterized protein VC83_06434 [Pseudogymnoascus destructans]OAF58364.1 hypothetical protein VC83_06434 [Pseudogymnoascus destructans]